MTLIDSATNTFSFDMNGVELIGDYHEGTPVANDPNAIIITGARIGSNGNFVHAGYFEFNPHLGGWNFTDGHGGGGGGGPSAALIQAANLWASTHLKLIGKTQADVHAWNVMHDDLVKFYEWASANPNSLIEIGNGTTVFAAIALADFNQVMINIQSTGGGDYGGGIQPITTGGATITFNPEDSDLSSEHTQYGDSIYDYGLFHELGHALDYANAQSQYNSLDSEAFANTAGRSMENYLGIPLANFSNGAPPGGYK